MSQDWLAVTAYTVNTPYEDEVKSLEKGLITHDVKHCIFPYLSVGDWRLNCQNKQDYIIRALKKYKCPVVWLDADARLYGYPALFDNYPYDVGLYKRMHTPKQKKQTGKDYHWDSGTMYYKPTARVINFLECQQELFELYNQGKMSTWPETSWYIEHCNLDVKLASDVDVRFTLGELPVTYSYIHGTRQPEEVKYKDAAIIIHTQASRRLKDKV